jgi:hypothetical protein
VARAGAATGDRLRPRRAGARSGSPVRLAAVRPVLRPRQSTSSAPRSASSSRSTERWQRDASTQ